MRQRSRPSEPVWHAIAVPEDVTPTAPASSQNEPGCTVPADVPVGSEATPGFLAGGFGGIVAATVVAIGVLVGAGATWAGVRGIVARWRGAGVTGAGVTAVSSVGAADVVSAVLVEAVVMTVVASAAVVSGTVDTTG